MKKTKFLVCLAAAFSALTISASADTKFEINGNSIKVTADGYAGKWGTMIVVKSGTSIDNNDNIVAVKQAKGGSDGKMIFTFALDDEKGASVDGKYDIYIKKGTDALASTPDEMYYARKDVRDNLFSSVKGASVEGDLTGILENAADADNLKLLGVMLDEYNAVKAKDDINNTYTKQIEQMFIEGKANLEDGEIIGALNTAINVVKINLSNTGDADISQTVENLGFSFENTAYGQITDTSRKQFIDNFMASGTYTSISEAETAYKKANILHTVNNTRFDELGTKIEAYASDLGITTRAEYISYKNATNKSAVNTTVATTLKNSPAVTVDGLLSVLSAAVTGNPPAVSPSPGSTPSGSTGSGGSITSLPVVAQKTAFDDLDGVSWAQTAVNALAEKGIVSGDENGKFNPDAAVKREEFVKMLVMAAGMYSETAECDFEDVAADAWYYRYVASAFKNGIAYGVTDTLFGVNTQITRQDMAVMCYRAASKVKTIPSVREAVEFADGESISEYAVEAVTALYRANVINGMGDDLFVPNGTATRAQAAVMIYNLLIK